MITQLYMDYCVQAGDTRLVEIAFAAVPLPGTTATRFKKILIACNSEDTNCGKDCPIFQEAEL